LRHTNHLNVLRSAYTYLTDTIPTMEVYHANDSFLFDNLQLTPPQHITGGSYMTRFSYCQSKQPLYIQTPKTLSKQGIVVAGKKAHIDLLLTTNDIDTELIEWITNLEKRAVDLLYEKRHIWFTQELDHTDIENSFTSPLRAYKSGNFLLRVNLEPSRHITAHVQPFICKIFDENKTAASIEYIKDEQSIISIIEFQGIKFTSRNFQIELWLRQVLVVSDVPLFETCVINSHILPAAPANASNSEPPSSSENQLSKCTSAEKIKTQSTNNGDDYLGLPNDKDNEKHLSPQVEPQENHQDEPHEKLEQIKDETERYIAERPALTHFECMEVDIDFKNIPDTIDVNEPSFELPAHQTELQSVSKNEGQQPKQYMKSKPIVLKKHKDVLYEMYKIAKYKANEMKRAAMRAYLEAKEIKAKYLLDDLDDLHSDTSDDDSNI